MKLLLVGALCFVLGAGVCYEGLPTRTVHDVRTVQPAPGEKDCIQAIVNAGPPSNANDLCGYLTRDQQDEVMVKIGSYLVKVAQHG